MIYLSLAFQLCQQCPIYSIFSSKYSVFLRFLEQITLLSLPQISLMKSTDLRLFFCLLDSVITIYKYFTELFEDLFIVCFYSSQKVEARRIQEENCLSCSLRTVHDSH